MIGPHEGRELDLMISGDKPLAMFTVPADADFFVFPEEEFDEIEARGELKKRVFTEKMPSPGGELVEVRTVMYSLPNECWRIREMCLVLDVYRMSGPGWHPDLERVIGRLLGYSPEDIEEFVDRLPLSTLSI